MLYILTFFSTFLVSVVLTLLIKQIAIKLAIVDRPDFVRKIHQHPIPLLGGVAVFLSFSLVLLAECFGFNLIIKDFIETKFIVGILLAGLIIVFGGILDDKFNLKPKIQFVFPLLATIIIIISGIGINHVRNPFGGIISFQNFDLILFWWQGLPYKITLLADLFTLIWLMGMMFTTKLLDGLDGLVSGITVIGSLIIFGITMSAKVNQPNTGLIALILAGAFAGFLLFNFFPAKIFLGESGALFAGLMLGVLGIISGSKVATTLLIMGLFILDVIWVIGRRLLNKKSLGIGDTKHLHFRLLGVGFSQRQAVLFLYLLTGIFGSLGLFLDAFGKLVALFILIIIMLILALCLVLIYKKKTVINNN